MTVLAPLPSKALQLPESRLGGLLAVVRWVGFALAGTTVFFPYLVSIVGNGVFIAAAGMWVYSVAELTRRGRPGALLAFWFSVPAVGFAATYLLVTATPIETAGLGAMPSLVRDFLLLAPICIGAGLVAAGDAGLGRLLVSIRLLAAATALGAVAEVLLRRQLLPGNSLDKLQAGGNTSVDALLLEGGGIRAVVAADHPLVLAALLAATVPLALSSRRVWWGRAEALLLVVGVGATDSAGPLGLAVIAVVLSVLVPQARSDRLLRLGSRLLPLAAAGFLAVSALVLRPVILPDSVLDASTQYRFAIYSLVPQILSRMPLGYGPGAVPRGELLIEEQQGAIDVARTVDSELVLSVIEYGLIGFVVFFAVLWIALRAPLRDGPSRRAALSLLMLTTAGLFLALHVWVSVLPMWMFLIGVGIHSVLRTRAATFVTPGGEE